MECPSNIRQQLRVLLNRFINEQCLTRRAVLTAGRNTMPCLNSSFTAALLGGRF